MSEIPRQVFRLCVSFAPWNGDWGQSPLPNGAMAAAVHRTAIPPYHIFYRLNRYPDTLRFWSAAIIPTFDTIDKGPMTMFSSVATGVGLRIDVQKL